MEIKNQVKSILNVLLGYNDILYSLTICEKAASKTSNVYAIKHYNNIQLSKLDFQVQMHL